MKPGWTTVALGDVAEVVMGQAPPGSSYNSSGEGLGLIAGAGDFKGGQIVPSKFTSAPGKISRVGDIVLSIRASIGAKVVADDKYCLGRGVAGIRATQAIDTRYLWHVMSWVEPDLRSKGRGATFLQVNRKDVAGLLLPLPPLDEQRRIAAILDASEGAIRRRDEQLVDLDRLIFSRVPVGQDGAIPLGAALKTIESGRSPNCEARPAMADEWGVLKLGAVSYGSYRADENKALLEAGGGGARYEVNAGDVLMTRKNTRDLVGAVAYVVTTPARRLLPDLIYRLTLDESQILPQYFQALMMTPLMRGRVGALASGSAASMVNLSHAKIKSLELPLASMGQQREYVALADEVGKMRQLVECARVADRELFTSLQSRAFRGEL